MKNPELAKYIDHTALKPNTTEDQIVKLCNEAEKYKFASVCVNPYWVSFCAKKLAGTGVDICTVIGFPLGANNKETKAFETKKAIENGATEVDMVVNVGAIKSGKWGDVEEDIKFVVEASSKRALVKVIIETCLLNDEEKVKVCKIAKKVGANFVKTSTGFSIGGATVEDIALMRKTVGEKMGVKASGGIRDTEKTQAMIDAGATRIGASAGVKIVEGEVVEGKGY